MYQPNIKIKETATITLLILFVIINLLIFCDASIKLKPRGLSYLSELEEHVLADKSAAMNNETAVVVPIISEVIASSDMGSHIATPVEQVIDEPVVDHKVEESTLELPIAVNLTVEVGSYPPNYATYRVISGDSLYWIAERFSTEVQELKDINGLKSEVIHTNQLLIVPIGTLRTYPVGLDLTDKEVEWIAQMIHAEARGEPYLGQVAVGAVIINRLKSHSFPNTLREVLYQDRAFQPISNKSFYQSPSDVSIKAALEALNGNDPTGGALYFFNPSISSDRFMHSRKATVTIGQHRFMR